ncbi:hypothetical protein WJX72_010487 [[Myrmecia] bisecta]|uniref:Protein N-terminal glutamine amidohydrolase n=1 Tax=[Myrmecia] bisecta TaxID=41462 RepID=A0AAW1PA38_9CHLO
MAQPVTADAARLPVGGWPFAYTACYCEENIYKLVNQLLHDDQAKLLYAVFLSNPAKQLPLWRQRAGHGVHGFVLWDYHVIAVESRQSEPPLVWDLDSTLELPCTLQTYAAESLGVGRAALPPEYARLFRVVPAGVFLQHFASNRSHMCTADGMWLAEPPAYPCITASDGTVMNLPQYIDMEGPSPTAPPSLAAVQDPFGVVLDEFQLLAAFGVPTDVFVDHAQNGSP